jgi:hypothetical protein
MIVPGPKPRIGNDTLVAPPDRRSGAADERADLSAFCSGPLLAEG